MINIKYEPVCVKCDIFPIIEIDCIHIAKIAKYILIIKVIEKYINHMILSI